MGGGITRWRRARTRDPAYRGGLLVIRAITHIEMPDTIVNHSPFALREKPEVIRCHRRVTLARIGPLPPIQSSINSLDLRNFFAGQHTSEISTARTVEKALYARHLLLSGRQVPEVYATEVARENADASMACCRRRRIEPSCRRQIEPTFKA